MTTKKSITTALLSFTALGIVNLPFLIASQPASALGFQTTRYSGGSCIPTNASNAAHSQVDSKGRIFNTSSTQVLVVNCPIDRDLFGSPAEVNLFAIDRKAVVGFALTCEFKMVNPLNGQVNQSSLFGTVNTVSSPTNAQQITSGFIPGVNVGVLNCSIPPAAANGQKQSGIAGYELVEQHN